MTIVGAIVFVVGLVMDTTVGSGLSDRMHNIGLLNTKLITVICGLLLGLAGIGLMALNHVVFYLSKIHREATKGKKDTVEAIRTLLNGFFKRNEGGPESSPREVRDDHPDLT